MIAIIAALPREIAALVKGSPADPALLRRGIHLHRLPAAVVVAAGMGSERASIAVQAALEGSGIATLVSAGLAGGCISAASPGAVIEAGTVIETRTGERFAAVGPADAILATSSSIASVLEKARLAQTYGAVLVDMEAASVARLASAHGLGFRAVKGISDAHDFELASLSRFAGKHGHFRTGAFAMHTAIRPHHWRKAFRLGRHSNEALRKLHEVLLSMIEQSTS